MTSSQSAQARKAMVLNQLRPQGVTDPAVLAAMTAVPREDYLPTSLKASAYGDRPLLLDDGSPVMAPAELGRLLTRLAPRAGEAALVIGKGGAYSAAVLDAMGLAVERADSAGSASGRYDLVLAEGALPDLPAPVVGLLAPHGRVGAAIDDRGVTRLSVGRLEGDSVAMQPFADAQVPMMPGAARPAAFVF
jgi:protein-L-isoaspartate(D-aspartate) O-methyltransferase